MRRHQTVVKTSELFRNISHMAVQPGMGVRPALEDAVESRRAAWRIIARVERTETSEIEAGEGILVELSQASQGSRAEGTQA